MSTRELILEAAGQVFAEKGFERATGKEICEMAGANAAAVNYHFGGTEGLYFEVVKTAHSRLVNIEALTAAVAGQATAKAKFKAFLDVFVRTATGPLSTSWAFRIIGREFLHRSAALDAHRAKERLPKLQLIRGIVGEVMGLPEDHPAVARGCIMVVGPLIMLLVGDRPTLKRALPSLGLTTSDADSLIQDMATYGLAGLRSMAE
jgi:AcrR family transcriptional regulator